MAIRYFQDGVLLLIHGLTIKLVISDVLLTNQLIVSTISQLF